MHYVGVRSACDQRSLEARSVRVYGGAGIVTGTARMESTARGQDTRFRIRYIAVYVKAQERWQMVAWQSTRIPDA